MYFQYFRDHKKHYNTNSSSESDENLLSSDSRSDYAILNIVTTMVDRSNVNLGEGADHLGINQQSRRSSASNSSYFPVHHSLSLLPIFKGTNISVTQFTNCKGVRIKVDPNDRVFFFGAVMSCVLHDSFLSENARRYSRYHRRINKL